ncbi:hypothetical protein AB204_13230 [Xenorhabdus khoisanae]|uniref:Uncharacterized protein n=1 Tax=Xenorhabdus khoisanae TaxID=880157 RepID=A0A0J5FQU8_9GAMM|nr:hypothetical protein AB204_13230 [Xenorhabdus khoisanae]
MQLSVHTWMQELHELQACSTPLSHLGSSHQHSPNYLRCLLNYIERTKDDNARISLATCYLLRSSFYKDHEVKPITQIFNKIKTETYL